MPTLDPNVVHALPPELQVLIYVILFIGTVIGSIFTYARARQTPSKPTGGDVVVTAGGFMDMQPVRDLAAQIMGLATLVEIAIRENKLSTEQMKQIADELAHIRQVMEERAKEEFKNEARRQAREDMDRDHRRG